jgi:hypothetical protein
MFTAREAHERTLKVYTAKHADIFKTIEEQIDEAIANEKTFTVFLRHEAPPQALLVLKDLGYNVIDNGMQALVSWAITDQ